jgi:hypothetical protein
MAVETKIQEQAIAALARANPAFAEPPLKVRTAAEKLRILTRLTLQRAAIDLEERIENGHA